MEQTMGRPSPELAVGFFGQLRKHWGWLLTLGIVNVILGSIGLGMTFWLTLASVIIYGVFVLVSGGIQLLQAFAFKGWKGMALHIIIAFLYIATGGVIIYNPLLASAIFTLILGIAFLTVGLFRVVLAFQHREQKNWGWLLINGLVTAALGGMILSKWPATGVWVIGLFIAIDLIFQGWSCIALALAARATK